VVGGAPAALEGRAGWQEWAAARRAGDGTLTVASWNVLSPTWWTACKEQGDYAHCPESVGGWEARWPALHAWVAALAPDVLTLQEVDYAVFDAQLLPAMRELGYDGRCQRAKRQAASQPCGVATFWRHDALALLPGCEAVFSRAMALGFALLPARGGATGGEGAAAPQLIVANVHLEAAL
jgi:mRNA deadenylase 3'-5' endonuclease subunit Ccr4